MPSLFPRGSEWRRWDLHFHTPSSFDYEDKTASNQEIVDGLIAAGIRVVAITDHHTMDIVRIRALQAIGGDELTILPAIELRDDHGGKPIHYICIFPEAGDLDHIWPTLQGTLGLTAAGIQEKGGNETVYIPIETGAELARRLGGVISIHAGAKTNSIEGISNKEEFQQRIKYDITKQWVDLMEIGQIKDIDRHHHIVFPATGLEKPLILCSDNHSIKNYATKAPLWFRADPTFRGLLMVIREPRDRVFIGATPDQLTRVEQNKTKFIRSITFSKGSGAPADEHWFSGTVDFNSGLVAVVGNKGSGKSALGDTLGLLGSTRNAPFFPFLSRERFRHPISGRAAHFSATLTWEAGDPITRTLGDTVKVEEVERVKYLPQDHVERICNELVGSGEEGFEKELRSVIFSHVPEAERLGKSTLDDLVRLQTEEKQKRIDSLLKQLRDESRNRATLEAQADPMAKRELEEKIKRRELELQAHEATKPPEVQDPTRISTSVPPDVALITKLGTIQHRKSEIASKITATNDSLKIALRREASAARLLEKLANFKKDFDTFLVALDVDARELGLKATELISLSLNAATIEEIRAEAGRIGDEARLRLDAGDGLRTQMTDVDSEIADLQGQLDAPNRAYQAYLSAVAEWTTKKQQIEGSAEDPESSNGLKAALAALQTLPEKIDASKQKQVELALAVRSEKVAQVAVYRALYAPVQAFIDSHAVATEKLKLEFRAELVNGDFSERLLGLLAQNRRGSFMGIDEGRSRAHALAESIRWEDEHSVRQFLESVDVALHEDLRPGQDQQVQLKDQLSKGKRADEVFNALYGLEYLRPRYILRWEGKDLSMLSPGERGTLLLVFYLLIDKEDIPLVIDQPEGNLDNYTVAKILVECIKETRKRRQVFIVTHNPNLAVVCDADQIVHASMDKQHGNRITYTCGSLENPAMSEFVTDVLEGTRWAFGIRDGKYRVGES